MSFLGRFNRCFASSALFFAVLALLLAGRSASPSAVEMDCFNCNGAYPRDAATGFP